MPVTRKPTYRVATFLAAGALTSLAALAACSQTENADQPTTPANSPAASATPSTPSPTLAGNLTVFAAASLTGSFDEIITQFESVNPGISVTASYDGSSTLVKQIQEGAQVDVFASADQANMDKLKDSGQVTQSQDFATNNLTIAVPADNPAGVKQLADLAKAGVKVVTCAPEVPCGAVASKVFEAVGVTVTPVSQEQNVKAVLTKVSAGEADAGLVYVTDVKAAGAIVTEIPLPTDLPTGTGYPIAVLKDSKSPDAAKAFIDFVLSANGQNTLNKAGFTPPGK